MKISENKVLVTILIICCIAFLIIQYNGSQRQQYLQNNYTFTIGKTVRYVRTDDGGNNYIKYRYYVDNMTFFHFVKDDYKNGSPLKKFFRVKYSKVKPEISEMYLSEEVIDSAQIARAGFKYIGN